MLNTQVIVPAPFNLEQVAADVGQKMLNGLSHLGFCHTSQEGRERHVCFKSVQVFKRDQRAWGFYEVDVHKLPSGVTADKLVAKSTIHHLGTVAGHKVTYGNTTGISYMVPFHVERVLEVSTRLPKRVAFNTAEAPSTNTLALALGYSERGPMWLPIDGAGHVLIAGATRSGKTSLIHAMITGLAETHTPAQVRIVFIDPKSNESALWRGLPHFLEPPASERADIEACINNLVGLMQTRSHLLAARAVRTLSAYNALMQREGGEALPQVVAFIDEFVDLISVAGLHSQLGKAIQRLANMAAGFGITLVLSATNPRGDVLDGLIRTNCPIRMCFGVPEASVSLSVLGVKGAEKIPGDAKGRMLARLGNGALTEIQTYFLDDAQLAAITGHLCKRNTRADVKPAAALSTLELNLVEHALAQLNGQFLVGKLYTAFEGSVPKDTIARTAQLWQRKGWLTTPAHATDGRKVTAVLKELVETQRVRSISSG